MIPGIRQNIGGYRVYKSLFGKMMKNPVGKIAKKKTV